jgi:hypothetical protein
MRAPFLMLPLTLALAAPLSGLAESAPRVIFCSGDCFAVDAQGVRAPAPKGTQLLPGQRLETGPGSYAQVKIGKDVAFGVGEKARVRLDPKGVFLDEGRIRVVGEQTARPVELRTDDSTFVLRGADIEMKKSGPSGPASPLLVKLNAGDATASGAALTNGGVRLVSAGSIIPGAPLPAAAITDAGPGRSIGPVAQAGGLPGGLSPLPPRLAPVNLPPVTLPPVARGPVVPPTLRLPPVVKLAPRAPEAPVLPFAPRLLAAPVINTSTGEILTLSTALILTVDPTYSYTTISPTLLDASLTTSTSTTTTTSTTLSSPILTTTTLTSPTTTTTTTYNLLSSPTLSTSTLCCTLR